MHGIKITIRYNIQISIYLKKLLKILEVRHCTKTHKNIIKIVKKLTINLKKEKKKQ